MSLTAEELRGYVAQQLNQKSIVPDGHRGAVGMYVDDSGARLVVAWKSNNGWEAIGNTSYHPHEDGMKVGFNLLKTW